jgi:stage II sporulation protein D
VEPLPGGYLRYVRVEHAGGQFEIRSDRFRSILIRNGVTGLKSTSFEVAPGPEPRTLELRGAGWGHGVGMCQYGAAKKGRSEAYGQVLAYYYPESEMKKVY